MTMPFSPNTTYVPSSTPAIKAQDLNDLQLYLSSLYSNLLSTKGAVFDGVGNNNVTSPARLDVQQADSLDDNALILIRDHASNVRSAYDHLGYPAGRASEYLENWDFDLGIASVLSFQPIYSSGLCRWNAFTTNGTRNPILTSPTGGLGGTFLSCTFVSANASDRSIVYGQYPWLQPQTYTSAVMEFEVNISSPVGSRIFYGLTDMNNGAGTLPANSSPWIGLAARRDTAATWQMIHGDGTTLVYTDLGIAIDPTISTWIRVRLELHGINSPFGACARLFFNDVQYGGNVTTNIPTVANLGGVGMTPYFGMVANATSSAVASVGPVRLVYNRVALSSPIF